MGDDVVIVADDGYTDDRLGGALSLGEATGDDGVIAAEEIGSAMSPSANDVADDGYNDDRLGDAMSDQELPRMLEEIMSEADMAEFWKPVHHMPHLRGPRLTIHTCLLKSMC